MGVTVCRSRIRGAQSPAKETADALADGIGKGYGLCWRREDKSVIKKKKLPVFRVR